MLQHACDATEAKIGSLTVTYEHEIEDENHSRAAGFTYRISLVCTLISTYNLEMQMPERVHSKYDISEYARMISEYASHVFLINTAFRI